MISLEVSLNHDKPGPRYILTCQGCGSTRPQSTGTPRSSPCDSLDMADPWKLDRADCCSNNMHVYALHCSVYFGVSIRCDLVEPDLQCYQCDSQEQAVWLSRVLAVTEGSREGRAVSLLFVPPSWTQDSLKRNDQEERQWFGCQAFCPSMELVCFSAKLWPCLRRLESNAASCQLFFSQWATVTSSSSNIMADCCMLLYPKYLFHFPHAMALGRNLFLWRRA